MTTCKRESYIYLLIGCIIGGSTLILKVRKLHPSDWLHDRSTAVGWFMIRFFQLDGLREMDSATSIELIRTQYLYFKGQDQLGRLCHTFWIEKYHTYIGTNTKVGRIRFFFSFFDFFCRLLFIFTATSY